MKKILLFLSAALFFSLMACDELADFMSVTFEGVEIEQIIDVPLNDLTVPSSRAISLVAGVDSVAFTDSIILNMNAADEGDSAKQELADFLEDISSINIDTLSVEIVESYDDITLPDDFELTSLTVSFFDDDSLLHTETHYNVVPGQLIVSPVTSAGLSGISTTLQQNKDLKVIASGAVIGANGIDYFALKTRIVADVKTQMNNAFVLSE